MNKVILYTAKWCTACPATKELLNKLKEKHNNFELEIMDFDAPENQGNPNDVATLPTVLFFKDEEERIRISNKIAFNELENALKILED